MISSFVNWDAILGTWIVFMLFAWIILMVIGDWRAIKRWLSTREDNRDEENLNKIEEAAFYLRNSGKQSTRGR